MRFKQTLELVEHALDLDKPTMLWGPPGIGKSQLMRSTNHTAFIDLRLVLLDAVDLRGLPARDGDKMRWLPVGELPHEPTERGILFLDEINAAEDDVMQAALGLVLDRRLGDYEVPEGWRIMAAGNRAEDRTGARDLPSALANRFLHIDMTANLDDWVDWASTSGQMPHELVSFLRFKTDLIHSFSPDHRRNPTPRMWETVGQIINDPGIEGRAEIGLIAAAVGEGPAQDLVSFLNIARSLPNVDEILVDPMAQSVPSEPAVIFATIGAICHRVQRETAANFITYVNRFSSEYTAMAVKTAVTMKEDLYSTAAFTQWCLDNQEIFSV